MSEYDDVRAFRRKFKMPVAAYPTPATKRELIERANFLLEELHEFAIASGLKWDDREYRDDERENQDLAGQADALVDIVYVAMGTALLLGLPWQELWDDVQRANMAKVAGASDRMHGDAIKPPGWQPPRTHDIIAAAIKGYGKVE